MWTIEEPMRAAAGGVFDMVKKKKEKEKPKTKKNVQTEGSQRIKKAKKKEKETTKDDGETTTQVRTTVSSMPQGHPIVEAWVQRALDTGVEKLRDEFRLLAKYTRADMTQTAFNSNGSANMTETKNRYQDVPCQDQCIVKLDRAALGLGSGTDYIHANFVGTPMNSEKRFICTQGPLDQTVEEFWLMIVQQKVEQIVMLCKTVEMGKFKCAQYWPEKQGEKKVSGSVTIENVGGTKPMERDAEIQVTMLNVVFNGTTLSVRHLHWTDWPDRGVPPCKLTSLELLSAVRGSKAPIVVHCSAGIGRTGTIVAIEYILENISHNKQECIAMPDLVKALRDMRAYSIQNDLQYLYIHRVMLNYFLDKYKDKYASILTPENVTKYEKFIKDYNAVVGQ